MQHSGSEVTYLNPDYEHPRDDLEDDYIEEVDEEEINLEKLLNEQEKLAEERISTRRNFGGTGAPFNTRPMSELPFGSGGSSPFGGSTIGGGNKSPWDRSSDGGSSWKSGYSSSWGSVKREEEKNPVFKEQKIRKSVIICDFLDCLYESWESNGKPGLLPRAIFDLKPRFNVWDRLASLAPEKVYIIFPSFTLIPSFGDVEIVKGVLIPYVISCISTYLRISRDNCQILLGGTTQNIIKEKSILSAINNHKKREEMVYIGLHSGRWGLSNRDIDAAHSCGIDYLDLYKMLEGTYEFE